MAINYRGKRVNYDNIAVGSVAGYENTITGVSMVSAVSLFGAPNENCTPGVTGGTFNNISNANRAGIEDTQNDSADKLTSDSDDISDAG